MAGRGRYDNYAAVIVQFHARGEKHMLKLSCFADEISPELGVQLKVMSRLGLKYMDFRSESDVSVLELSAARLKEIRSNLDDAGVRVACVGSAVGKIPFSDGLAPAMRQLEKAVEAAHAFETHFVRVFSFFQTEDDPDVQIPRAAERLRQMAEFAAGEEIVLVSENECDVLTDTSPRCAKLLRLADHPNLRAAFDPSNFRGVGERPFDESFPRLKPHIAYVHIKDSKNGTDEKVVAGQGDAQIAELLEAFSQMGGLFLSLEPHLVSAGRYRGFSGKGPFSCAYDALTGLLTRLGIAYE